VDINSVYIIFLIICSLRLCNSKLGE